MSKTIVIDTNILLHDPEAILQFPKQNLIIPITVLEKLNDLKKFHDERGKTARKVLRFLELLQHGQKGNLNEGF